MHYEAGRYSVAAALLEEAYALHPEPKLLYNLGRAREAAGEAAEARAAYEAYLQNDPATQKREEVTARIEALQRQLVSEPSKEDTATPAPPASTEERGPAETKPSNTEHELEPPPSRRTVPWVMLGVGGATLTAALTVGILARAQAKDAEREPAQIKAAELQTAAERKALTANVLAGAGGALLIAGGAWLLFGGRDASSQRSSHSKNRNWALRVGAANVDCVLRF